MSYTEEVSVPNNSLPSEGSQNAAIFPTQPIETPVVNINSPLEGIQNTAMAPVQSSEISAVNNNMTQEVIQNPIQPGITDQIPQQIKETKEYGSVAREYIREIWDYTKDSHNQARWANQNQSEQARSIQVSLGISKANIQNRRELDATGFSPETLWKEGVEEYFAGQVTADFLKSLIGHEPGYLIDSLSIAHASCQGEIIGEDSYANIFEKSKSKLAGFWEKNLDYSKDQPVAPFKQFGDSKSYSGSDAILYLSEQIYGTEFANGLKLKYKEIMGRDYQGRSKLEDMQDLRISKLDDLLLRNKQLSTQ